MKIFNGFALAACLALMPASGYIMAQTAVNEYGTEWKWNNGTIEVTSPEREPGQKSVLGLTLPAMESVRV